MTPEEDLLAEQAKNVQSYTPDLIDPSWSKVTTLDGQVQTMPTSQAEAMPQVAPPPPVGPGVDPGTQSPFGDEAPLNPSAGQQSPFGDDPSVGPVVPSPYGGFIPASANPGAELDAAAGTPTMENAPGNGPGALQETPGALRTLSATAQPGAGGPGAPEPALPGQDVTTKAGQTVTENQTVANPADVAAGLGNAYSNTANALDQQAQGELNAKRVENASLLASNAARLQELQDLQKKAQIHTDEARKAVQAIEATPIDQDFFSGSPGREVAAWIALGLSGFLQGQSRGSNPALAQMMTAMQNAQSRFIDEQRRQHDSAFNQRFRLLQDAKATEDSIRMQIPGLIEKHAQLQAQKLGLAQMPAAVSTVAAQMRVAGAKAQADVGMFVQRRTDQRFEAEQKPAEGATTAELQNLHVSPKMHEQAMSDKGGALGTKVQVADQMKKDLTQLEAIAAKRGGELQGQTLMSWSRLGLASTAARAGNANAQEQVQAQQIIDRFMLSAKQGGNVKLFDSDKEAAAFEKTINTGTPQETMAALRDLTARAERNARATASAYAPQNPQGYVDYVRKLVTEPGGGQPAFRERVVAPPAQQPQSPQQQPAAPTGGGPAQPPLPTSPSASAPGTHTAASNEDSPVKLATLQRINSEANAAGLNGAAITKIVRFESGGRADAVNHTNGKATGLIQWMPDVFAGMKKPPGYENVQHADLKDLTAEEQVPLVIQYFKEKGVPANADIGDYYLAVAAPAFVGKPDSAVVYPQGSEAWKENPAWRPADGGAITAGSIRARARKM